MNYVLEPRSATSFAIVNRDAVTDAEAGYPCVVGFVHRCGGSYWVERGGRGSGMHTGEQIATVNSPEDAIPALAAYLEKNPPQWKDEGRGLWGNLYTKFTPFGMLWVSRDRCGKWWAYRGGLPYFRGRPVLFRTAHEAQQAADVHSSDWLANSVVARRA